MKKSHFLERIYTLMIVLGLAVSCSSDKKSSGPNLEFKGGIDPVDSSVLDGASVVTSFTLSSSGVENSKLPAANTSVKLCYFILSSTVSSLPHIGLFGPSKVHFPVSYDGEGGATIQAGINAESISRNIVRTLAGGADVEQATIKYQGFHFEVTVDGSDSSGKIQVKGIPKLNETYVPALVMHAKNCSSNSVVTTTVTALSAATDSKAKKSKAIWVFRKGKIAKLSEQTEASFIILDQIKIDLSDKRQDAEALVAYLEEKINAGTQKTDFRKAILEKKGTAYGQGAYVADRASDATRCGIEESEWKTGYACLILERILWGKAGNGFVPYAESYVKIEE